MQNEKNVADLGFKSVMNVYHGDLFGGVAKEVHGS